MRNEFMVFSVVSVLLVGVLALAVSPVFYWIYLVLLPIVGVGIYDMIQRKHTIMRNYPVLGRGRYLMEELRPKIYQYFVESDLNGRPFSRAERSVVYQRAKRQLDSTPFGTQLDVYAEGYEWVNHSIAAVDFTRLDHNPRVIIGEEQCSQPYSASIFNISAMSYGALSKNAVMALNEGAKIGGFAHNTGEGGISPYHLMGGDLIFQLGTGYFGARDEKGNFSPEIFAQTVSHPEVKMIELKLSQGAKPGHGGILPAVKNTPEIARIRHVVPFTQILSPAYHTAFNSPVGLLELLAQMRELSGGKPVGFKLCVGSKVEFIAICKAMVETGLLPDFITVDGGEGGTGAAPIEFSNSVGMPFKEGLAFVHDALTGYGLRKRIKILGSGKMSTGYHLFRAMALGADACYSARAMMLALGCIQALLCNKNTCPTGITTHDKELTVGLHVADKKVRVANFHRDTVDSFIELMAGTGLDDHTKINRSHVYHRSSVVDIRTFDQIFPYIPAGALLQEHSIPADYQRIVKQASKDSFLPVSLAQKTV